MSMQIANTTREDTIASSKEVKRNLRNMYRDLTSHTTLENAKDITLLKVDIETLMHTVDELTIQVLNVLELEGR